MKKSIVAALVIMAMVMAGSLASAATRILPAGAKVSATVSSDGMATISVSGVSDIEKVEYYAYEGIKAIDGNSASINLREGRRFQVVFGGGLYSLLTPEMAAIPHPEFFGPGVGLDCSNPGGCCFIVTGK